MSNKNLIDKLKNNAELAWASYGYFDLAYKSFDKDILEKIERKENPTTTYQDVLNVKYKNCKAIGLNRWGKEEPIGTLKGDFSPTQAKRFFEKYDLLKHQHNTNSGFSATLFAEKRLQINKETKEKSYTAKYGYTNYILSFRGTEVTIDVEKMLQDFYTDFLLARNTIPQQYFDMIDFIETQIKPIIYDNATQSYAKMTIAGHSLGGFLAQMFALSYPELVEEVYT